MTTLIFGHQNPDTDAITAAMSWAEFQRQLGNTDVEAVALGKPNAETQYVLDYFKVDAPRVVESIPEGGHVMLVDHNEFQQSVVGIEKLTIDAVVDHHRIANFTTAAPLYYRAEAIGSTNSVIYNIFKEHNFEISAQLAGLMAAGLISDTLLLKSPTATPRDKEILPELAKIAGINLEEFGLAMLKAGTNLGARSDKDIIDGDAKSFDMAGQSVRIGQVNTVDLDEIYARQADLTAAMQEEATAEGYDLFLLIATDILNSNSVGFMVGSGKDQIEAAFGQTFDGNNRIDLPGVVSRKKQVVPQLTAAFEG